MMNRYHFNEEQHLHTLDGKSLSGTSSIVGVLNKPGLTWWASGKALEPLGWTPTKTAPSKRGIASIAKLGEIKKMHGKEYLELLDKCYRNHKDSLEKSADKGIDLHSELERYIKYSMDKNGADVILDERIKPFAEWSEKNVKRFLWSEAHCYSERLWTGGICDAGCLLNDGTVALIDFKSSREAYLGHFFQCAGYDIAISENSILNSKGEYTGIKLDLKISKYIIFPFGAKTLEPWENKLPIEDLKKGFEACTQIYRIMGSGEK
jgi:hypothetical protein